MTKTARFAMALIAATGLTSSACTFVVPAQRVPAQPTVVYKQGPPPHAPAHGYRHKQRDCDLVYDSGLSAYIVVGVTATWFVDGVYFRLRGDYWEQASASRGPWVSVQLASVPYGLKKARGNGKGHGKSHGNGHAKHSSQNHQGEDHDDNE